MSSPSKILYVLLVLHQVAVLPSSLGEDFVFKATVKMARASIRHHPRRSYIVKVPTQRCPTHPVLNFFNPAFLHFHFSYTEIHAWEFACCPNSHRYRCGERRKSPRDLPVSPWSLQHPSREWMDVFPHRAQWCVDSAKILLRKEGIKRDYEQNSPHLS